MARRISRLVLALVLLSIAAACAPPGPQGQSQSQDRSATGAARKSITISMEGEISALATELDAAGVSGLSRYIHDFMHNYLTTRGDDDEVLPQLVTELPSLEAGTWQVFPDGRMDVTWKLRRGVLWHDGTEFTSADVKFGWDVTVDPTATLGTPSEVARRVDAVETPDAYTFIAHWRETSRWARELGRAQMDLLPRHLLEADFRANKEAFANHPYFTSTDVVIGTGPYRAVQWTRGSQLVVEAFDRYWQGPPKIGRVTFKFIKDNQAVLANLLAGETDVANRGLSWDGVQVLLRDWAPAGKGQVQVQPTNFRHVLFQLRPEAASPPDLLNVNVRRALTHALNRDQLIEGVYPGASPDLVAHSIGFPGTAIGDTLERAIVKYPYDPNRARQLLEDAGWRRGADGILVKPSGERLRVELQAGGDTEDDKTFTLMEGDYRAAGIELTYKSFGGRRQTPEDTATFPGLQKSGLPFNQPTFGRRWDGRDIAAPENRYSGGNRSAYSSPVFDRALDDIERSIRFDEELSHWAEAWKQISEDAAVIGLFFVPNPIAARKGVSGVFPANASGSATWRANTWDME